MSDIDEVIGEIENIANEVMALERRIDTLDRTFVKCTNDILEAIKLQSGMLNEIQEVMSLIRSPSDADLERYGALREAFDRYDFVRKLTLGKENKK